MQIDNLEFRWSKENKSLTYVFDMCNDYVPSNSQEYTVIAKTDVAYDYWVYLLRPDVSRDRRQMHSFPAQIALKTR